MKCLALDTTTDICSVAVTDGPELLGEHNFAHRMDLSRRLMPNIVQLVKDCGLEMKGLEAVGVSLGPGSFTGLRIGVVTAKTLAQTLAIPIAGIVSLDLLAKQFDYLPNLLICPLIKVRKSEVYYALFRANRGLIERISDYEAGSVNKLIRSIETGFPDLGSLSSAEEEASPSQDASRIPSREVVFCGDGLFENLGTLCEALGDRVAPTSPWLSYPKASILGGLAAERISAGESADPLSLVPFYIRRSAPEMRLERSST